MTGARFTDEAWQAIAPVRAALDGSVFLERLGVGELDPAVFRHYLEQDVFYLAGYAKALALLAAGAPDPAAAGFWASAAHTASLGETALHTDLLGSGVLPPGRDDPEPSPTTLGYTSFLVATAATDSHAVAAAAVLPCFWLYAEVARRLAERARVAADHPFGRWIATYDGEEFGAAVVSACRLVDEAMESVGPAERVRAHRAFARASRYELMFFETALTVEDWPLPV